MCSLEKEREKVRKHPPPTVMPQFLLHFFLLSGFAIWSWHTKAAGSGTQKQAVSHVGSSSFNHQSSHRLVHLNKF